MRAEMTAVVGRSVYAPSKLDGDVRSVAAITAAMYNENCLSSG